MNKDLSVIIPVYNVSEYLIPCLDSVKKAIGHLNAEVLLIDDGSTDGSGTIAETYAQGDPCFICFHKENGGLGSARNYGVRQATGKYLMFLDSDDLIEPDMYDNMFELAEETESDITICNVSRFDSKRFSTSNLHLLEFNGLCGNRVTHITRNHALFYDTIACNKLIRRSFFTENGFAFPENHVRFEDIPVTLPMHYLANQVAIIQKPEYLWRIREGESKSITQSNSSIKNLLDRIKGLNHVFDFYEAINDKKLLKSLQVKVLKVDLNIYLNMIGHIPKKTAKRYADTINDFICDHIDQTSIDLLPLYLRQKYDYLSKKDIPSIVRLNKFFKQQYNNTSIIRNQNGYSFDLPKELFTINDRDAYSDFQDYGPDRMLDDIDIDKGNITLTTHIFNPRISTEKTDDTFIEVSLLGNKTGKRIPLSIKKEDTDRITKKYGTVYNLQKKQLDHYTYENAGFSISLDLKCFSEMNPDDDDYYFECRYQTTINQGCCLLYRTRQLMIDKCAGYHFVTNSHIFHICFDTINQICIRTEKIIDKRKITVDREKSLLIMPEFAGVSPDVSVIGSNYIDSPREGSSSKLLLSDDAQYKIHHTKGNHLEIDPVISLKDGRYLISRIDRNGDLIIKNKTEVVLWNMTGSDKRFVDYELTLYSAELKKTGTLTVTDKVSGKQIYLSKCELVCNGDHYLGKGRIDIDALNELKLCAGRYAIGLFYEGENHEIYDSWFSEADFLYKASSFHFMTTDGHIVMTIVTEWPEGESTQAERQYATNVLYEKYRKEPIDDHVVMFESVRGTRYSNNPRAIYEYIDQNHPEYTCVWSFVDPNYPIVGKGIKVLRGSSEYYHYLATARYLFNDFNFENAYVKREGQIEIQTMHGTPYKHFGLDVRDEFPTKNSVWQYVRKSMRWDYLISQGTFLDRNAFRMFKYYKTILKTGYPRTDSMMKEDPEKTKGIKQSLNIPLDKKVIFYAPTWRELSRFDLNLDLNCFMKALGDDYVFVFRAHYLSLPEVNIKADNKTVFDLSYYSNIEDLYQISDMMITDYSSTMFDYALTGKPMIFYVYDLDEYEHNLRGTYFDLRKEAPGPLVYSEEELLDAVLHIEKADSEDLRRIHRFKERYLTHETPHSARDVFENVFVRKRKTVFAGACDFFRKASHRLLSERVNDLIEKIQIHLLCLDRTFAKEKQ